MSNNLYNDADAAGTAFLARHGYGPDGVGRCNAVPLGFAPEGTPHHDPARLRACARTIHYSRNADHARRKDTGAGLMGAADDATQAVAVTPMDNATARMDAVSILSALWILATPDQREYVAGLAAVMGHALRVSESGCRVTADGATEYRSGHRGVAVPGRWQDTGEWPRGVLTRLQKATGKTKHAVQIVRDDVRRRFSTLAIDRGLAVADAAPWA